MALGWPKWVGRPEEGRAEERGLYLEDQASPQTGMSLSSLRPRQVLSGLVCGAQVALLCTPPIHKALFCELLHSSHIY